MAKREVLAKIECPGCDFDGAEIKLQKDGVRPYIFCPECNLQVFARTEAQAVKMFRAVGKIAAAKPAPVVDEQGPAPVVEAPKPAPVKAKKPATPPVVEAPKPAPVKRSAFADALSMLGGN